MEVSMELNGSASLWTMFKMGPQRTFHRVCLAAIIQMFLQMSGTNAVIFYCKSKHADRRMCSR